jgi:putative tryptophan/tyrosine transport system substrate-binding protein
MRRRDFIAALGGAVAAWPPAARAQQARMKRVVVLLDAGENDAEWQARLALLRRALEKLGWTEGRNIRIDAQWTGPDPQRMRTVAAEAIRLTPDVIVTATNLLTSIVGERTRTIPIVFAGAGDAVGTGLVASMAHPGGNITGFTTYESQIAGKKLELLKQAAPNLTRVAAIYTPGGAGSLGQLHVTESAASALNLSVAAIATRDGDEMERAVDTFAGEPNGALTVLTGPAVIANRARIISLAARHRLPAIYSGRYSVLEGGLMSYGASIASIVPGAASYVDRVLRGEKPGDLPVQLATNYEFVINLKTARALGLTMPPALLALADEVIE